MKILKLSAENIKRLSVVEIQPDGSPVIVIGGKNGAGKSSVLDAIAMALGGKELIPGKPIRRGQKTARVSVDLGDIIVTRTFTEAGGGELKVTNKDGARYPSPQAMLDKLIGRLSFDPLAFERMEKPKQLQTLRQLVGLDTTDLDFARSARYEERTGVNRTIKQLEGQLAGTPHHEDAPAEPVSVAALTAELEAADATRDALENAKDALGERLRDLEDTRRTITRYEADLAKLRAQMTELESRIETRRAAELDAVRLVEEVTGVRDAAQAALIDPAPIRAQLAAADSVNAKVRANQARAAIEKQLEQHRASSQALTAKLEEIDRQKQQRIESAKYPVIGLGCDEEGVTFDGLPFDQASQALRLRVSVAIGIALNPRLKVLLVREGSALDSESLQLLAEMAGEADCQVWLEKVAESRDGVTVLIEDGAVKQDALELTGEATS